MGQGQPFLSVSFQFVSSSRVSTCPGGVVDAGARLRLDLFKSDLGTEANHIRSEPCVPGPCLLGPTRKSIALLRQKDRRTSTDAFLLFAQGKGMIKGGAPAAGDAAGRRLYCIAHPVKVHP